MKKNLIMLLAVLVLGMVMPVSVNADGNVYISTGKSAKKYHKSRDCRAIKNLDKSSIKSLSVKGGREYRTNRMSLLLWQYEGGKENY